MTVVAITRDEIAHFARLSGLDLAEEELDQLAPQLDEIITALRQVQEVATDGVPPTSDGLQLITMFRSDHAEEPSPDPEDTLAQASGVAQQSGVPQIVAED